MAFRAFTEIGVNGAIELSVEETEKPDIMPRSTTMPEGVSAGEPLPDDVGPSVEKTAEVLRVSPITVMREWKSAKAWLYRELAGPTANG